MHRDTSLKKTRGKRTGGRKIVRKGEGKRKPLPNIPFPLLATPDLGHTFQFLALNAANQIPVTRATMLNLILQAATATSAYSMLAAVKIKKICIWSPIVSAFSPQEVQIEWNGGLYAPSAIHSAISEGLFPAKIRTFPPPMSSPSLWSLSGASNLTEVLFTVTCPQFSVLQVSCAIRLMDDEVPATPVVAAGATVGKVYYNYLDGLTSGELQPSGGVAVLP